MEVTLNSFHYVSCAAVLRCECKHTRLELGGSSNTFTFQNNLNPDWKDFLIYESELGTGTNDDIE